MSTHRKWAFHLDWNFFWTTMTSEIESWTFSTTFDCRKMLKNEWKIILLRLLPGIDFIVGCTARTRVKLLGQAAKKGLNIKVLLKGDVIGEKSIWKTTNFYTIDFIKIGSWTLFMEGSIKLCSKPNFFTTKSFSKIGHYALGHMLNFYEINPRFSLNKFNLFKF